MPFLLLIMLAVPLIEIALFIQIGGEIGLLATIAIVILTALIGSALLRHQGMGTLRAAQEAMGQQRRPLAQVFDGFCLLIAGAFLLTPGFLTDTIGFLLFIPRVRAVIGRWLWEQLSRRGDVHVFTQGGGFGHGPGPRRPSARDDVVDGDFREVPPDEEDPQRRLQDGDDMPHRPGPPRR